ncbi:MAG: hypothetical protein VSS75_030225 [Candidatus Parabeggiatoa sp.]|nr:hypothetical protein [Candidatus Parabeggiatoa sp.]
MLRNSFCILLLFSSTVAQAIPEKEVLDLEECQKQLYSSSPEIDCEIKFTNPKFAKDSMGFIDVLKCRASLRFHKGELMNKLNKLNKLQSDQKQTMDCEITLAGKTKGFLTHLDLEPTVEFENALVKNVKLGIKKATGVAPFIEELLKRYGNSEKFANISRKPVHEFIENLFGR